MSICNYLKLSLLSPLAHYKFSLTQNTFVLFLFSRLRNIATTKGYGLNHLDTHYHYCHCCYLRFQDSLQAYPCMFSTLENPPLLDHCLVIASSSFSTPHLIAHPRLIILNYFTQLNSSCIYFGYFSLLGPFKSSTHFSNFLDPPHWIHTLALFPHLC
jgi:hypothetical protein